MPHLSTAPGRFPAIGGHPLQDSRSLPGVWLGLTSQWVFVHDSDAIRFAHPEPGLSRSVLSPWTLGAGRMPNKLYPAAELPFGRMESAPVVVDFMLDHRIVPFRLERMVVRVIGAFGANDSRLPVNHTRNGEWNQFAANLASCWLSHVCSPASSR